MGSTLLVPAISRARNLDKFPKVEGIDHGNVVKYTKPHLVVAIREASAPFHHDTSKYGPCETRQHFVHNRWVKFKYAKRPTKQQQHEFLRLPAIVCGKCSTAEMKQNKCHALWLCARLACKLKVRWAPDLISAAIPQEMITQAKEDGNWGRVAGIHEYAYKNRKGCHINQCRGCPNVPRLIRGVKMGVSIFGNPFSGVKLPLSKALFERYVDKDFQPLTDEEVQDTVSAFAS